MKKIHFPYIALGIGLLLMLFILEGSKLNTEGETRVSLLTLLVFNECAFFLTAVGSYIGASNYKIAENKKLYLVTTALCVLLTVLFLLQGIALWPL